MPFDDDDSKYITPVAKSTRGSVDPHLSLLLDFAHKNNLTPGSTVQGKHNANSRHYSGNALDIKGSGSFSNAYVAQLSKLAASAGLILRDERRRPAGQAVWGGPHIHLEHAPSQSEDDKYITGPSVSTNEDSKYVTGEPSSKKVTESDPWGVKKRITESGQLDKLARDIEWHFGYGVLQAFPKLPEDKQKQIAQLATQYAASDEVKKKNGQPVLRSPAWQLLNQQRVGAVEGKDIEARQPPDVQAKMAVDFSAGANPLLRLGPKTRWLADMFATGGAGIGEFVAGAGKMLQPWGRNEGAEALRATARQMKEMSAEAEAVAPTSEGSKLAKGAGSGVIEYAPLMALPEAGLEGVFARVGLSAFTGGAYTGTQAVGRGESAKDVAKTAGIGATQFALLGTPTGKQFLTKALSSVVVVGGGTVIISRATGQPWSKAAQQGLIMTVMHRAPELLGRLRIKDTGGERPATVREVRGLLPAAKFDIETGTPKPSSPMTMTLPAKQSGRALKVEPKTQGELFTATRPGEAAGRSEPPGEAPAPLTIEQFSQNLALDPAAKETLDRYQEYREGFKKDSANVQQMAFTMAGTGGERVPIFDSRVEEPQAALVRLQRLRTDPEIWNSLSTPDRASIGRSIAALKSGKSPAQILDEAALSSQYPGVMRMSEGTARLNLERLREDVKTAKGKSKTAIQNQIDVLEKAGAKDLPKVPKQPRTPVPNRKTRALEQVARGYRERDIQLSQQAAKDARAAGATQEEIEAAASGNVSRETSNKFAGQEGAVNAANLPGVRTVLKAQRTASAIASKKGVWDFMRYTRDVADNKARIFGQTNARELTTKLRRAIGLPINESALKRAARYPTAMAEERTQALAQDALTFVIESNGNPAELQAMRQKITASTQALPGWKKRSLRAIDYAEQNYSKLTPVAQEYSKLTDAQRTQELSNGVKSYYRPGYVMHAQEIEGEMGWLEGRSGTGGSGFRHQRTYDTYADSIAAGINPKSLNAVDLLRTRLTNGQSMLNRRAWVDSLRTTVDPKTTLPVVDKVAIDPVTHVAEAPAGYSVESVGPQQVAVQKGYEGMFKALNNPSAFRQDAGGRLLTSANAAGKSYSLVFDTYHLGRLSTWNSILRLSNLKNPNPFSFGKGITLLDTSLPELQNMIQRGELKAADYPQLAQSKTNLDLLVDNGYNVGNISDAIYSDIVHKVPLAGDFNKWLFGQFQRGAMTEVGLMEFAKRRTARAAYETEVASARYVAKKLNTRFGNFGRQGWIKSATFQDAARLVFLAPQWNEGLIKSEYGAVKETGQAIVEMFQGKPIYVGPLARSVGTLAVGQFVGNQIINMITRGHPTWMNQEEGWGSKISAWVPDFVGHGPGFFIHPFGLAAETSLLLTKGYERAAGVMKAGGSKADQVWSWLSAMEGDTLDYLRSRSSILMRPVWTGVSGKDYMNKPIRPEDRFKQTLKDAIPRPLPAPAIYDTIFGTQYPGELQGRLMQSFGIRTERAPSGEQRIRTLARQFNQSKGVGKQGEFYESPYMQLTETKSPEAARELLKSKTREQVLKYYEQRVDKPLTGSADREREFLKTLNPEQRGQYFAAKGQRRQDLSEIRKLLASVGK
jgi:hypothetical protein